MESITFPTADPADPKEKKSVDTPYLGAYSCYEEIAKKIISRTPLFKLQKFDYEWRRLVMQYNARRSEAFDKLNIPVTASARKPRYTRSANEEENKKINHDHAVLEHLRTMVIPYFSRKLKETNDDPELMKYALHTSSRMMDETRFYGDSIEGSTLFDEFILPELEKCGHKIPSLEDILRYQDERDKMWISPEERLVTNKRLKDIVDSLTSVDRLKKEAP